MNKFIAAFLLVFLLQNCFAQDYSSNAPSAASGATSPKRASSVAGPEGPEHEVDFYIETNKRLYRQGENIYIRFWIKNNSGCDVRTFFKDSLIDFFSDRKPRGYRQQEIRDFVVDKSGFPRYVVLCIPTDKRKSTGDSLRQVIVKPGFYLTGKFNAIIIHGAYWRSNVVPIEVWNAFDLKNAGVPEEEEGALSGEEFLAQKPEGDPFVEEPF